MTWTWCFWSYDTELVLLFCFLLLLPLERRSGSFLLTLESRGQPMTCCLSARSYFPCAELRFDSGSVCASGTHARTHARREEAGPEETRPCSCRSANFSTDRAPGVSGCRTLSTVRASGRRAPRFVGERFLVPPCTWELVTHQGPPS